MRFLATPYNAILLYAPPKGAPWRSRTENRKSLRGTRLRQFRNPRWPQFRPTGRRKRHPGKAGRSPTESAKSRPAMSTETIGQRSIATSNGEPAGPSWTQFPRTGGREPQRGTAHFLDCPVADICKPSRLNAGRRDRWPLIASSGRGVGPVRPFSGS